MSSDFRIKYSFLFFQAEDGIRDYKVTGVQPCALPISLLPDAGQDVGQLFAAGMVIKRVGGGHELDVCPLCELVELAQTAPLVAAEVIADSQENPDRKSGV